MIRDTHPLSCLTKDPTKNRLYSLEKRFLEVFLEFDRQAPEMTKKHLHNLGLMIIRPELVKRGGLLPFLRMVETYGFSTLLTKTISLDQPLCSSIWRYQWNCATADRRKLSFRITDRQSALVVLLKKTNEDNRVPATVALSALKGSAKKMQFQQHHLRHKLGMKNRMIGFIHCSDEPIDMLRELGLIFSDLSVFEFLSDILRNETSQDAGHEHRYENLMQLEKVTKRHPVDLDETLARRGASWEGSKILHEWVARNREGMDLSELLERFGTPGNDTDYWDQILILAEVISHDLPNTNPKIGSVDLASWYY